MCIRDSAYVEQNGNEYHSCLLGVDPLTREGSVLYKVKLPGNPIIGEGKPENQNHAVIFARGECLQTLDMNQDNYMGEAFKMRNLLEGFVGEVRIIGFREHIFSEQGGAVANFAASNEFVFGTIVQRWMTWPLCVRFHYGHPDVWDRLWCMSNGGVSRASRTLHVSEDIFGGANVILRGGVVEYYEYIHCGKGRDITFAGVNGFEQKIAGGNAYQIMSRDLHRLTRSMDFFRLLSFFSSGSGFYLSNAVMTWALYWFVFTQMLIAATNRETFFSEGIAFDVASNGGEQVYNANWMIQLGFIMMLPLFIARWTEQGLWKALKETVTQLLSLKFFFGLFAMRTSMYYLDRGLRIGQAEYVATGRSFLGMTSNFTAIFKLYARSHLLYAGELTILLVVYGLYSRVYTNFPSTELGYYGVYTSPLWLLVVGTAFSPWLFNPCVTASV